jgi:pimeloyl-ACP methyl ester carboxylesterase
MHRQQTRLFIDRFYPRVLLPRRKFVTTSSSISKDADPNLLQQQLHYEILKDGKIVNKNIPKDDWYAMVSSSQIVIFLHGLLGNAQNIRQPAKGLTKLYPDLMALIFDLRGHGQTSSLSSSHTRSLLPPRPPHTLENCARDVLWTVHALDLTEEYSPLGIIGHSLGGRVALEYLYATTDATTVGSFDGTKMILPPRTTWILDSFPGGANATVTHVLDTVSKVPMPVEKKQQLVQWLQSQGLSEDMAVWMTTNLVKRTDGYHWTFDFNIAQSILEDFRNQDMIQRMREIGARIVQHQHPSQSHPLSHPLVRSNITIDLVMAGRNPQWSRDVIETIEGIRESTLESVQPSFLCLHRLENAGHNVHIDDLPGLMHLFQTRFDSISLQKRIESMIQCGNRTSTAL